MSNRRFLIIGSNSFSGSNFVKYLQTLGEQVALISRSQEPVLPFAPYRWGSSKRDVEFHQIDIDYDLPQIEQVVKRFRPTHVINYAALAMVAESWDHPVEYYQTNLLSQIGLHEIFRRSPGLQKFVQVSTPEVYGSTPAWISESFSHSPSTPYAASRAACDLHLLNYMKQYDFPVVFTRASNVYGPGQQLYRLIPRALFSSRLEIGCEKMFLDGGGTSERGFVYIDDLNSATYHVAIDGRVGEIYHIATGEIYSIREVVERVAELRKISLDTFTNFGPERPGKDLAYRLKSEKIRMELGWCEEVSLKQGIENTAEWMEEYLPQLTSQPRKYEFKK